MNWAKIGYRTAGIVASGAIAYDAYLIGKEHSHRAAQMSVASNLENVVAAERTTSNESYVTSAMQKKVSGLRSNNPLIPMFGSIKGFITGVLSSLAGNFIPVIFTSMALLGKNKGAKYGTIGLGIYGAIQLLREGFGWGKATPIDKA